MNSTLNTTDEVSWEEEFRDVVRFGGQRILIPIVVIIGVLGNLVTIYILTRRPMRSSTNVYLSALAVSDLLYLLFNFSMSLSHYPNMELSAIYWTYRPIGHWLTDAASSTSVWITVSFTIERFIAVRHPLAGKIMCTEERAIKVATFVYFACFLLTLSTTFEWKVVDSINEFNQTVYSLNYTELGNNETYIMVFFWFTSIFFTFIPVMILGILNFILILTVRRSRVARKSMTNQNNSSIRYLQAMRQENRITITLIAVVIVFFTCHLPAASFLIFLAFHKPTNYAEDCIYRGLGTIFNLLMAIGAACNFLLYTAMSDKYRKYFCAFFFCWKSGQLEQNPYEMDTMATSMSLSRGTSLRMDLSTRNPHNHSIRREGRNSYSPKYEMGPGRSENIYMKKPDGGNIPLIQVDQV